jgi:glucose/arabinose dehydrogenase
MRGFSTVAVLAALLLAGCGGGSSEADQPAAAAGYRFVQVASGLDQPVHVSAPRNQPGRIYVVEQTGRIRIVQNGRVTGTLVDLRSQVVCCGEQGLLSVAFHPRYARNGKYYVNYTDRRGDTRVVEYRGKRRLRQILFVDQPYSNHNGGQTAFGPDGRLYVGMGDGGAGGDPENRAQNLGSRLGKLLAINVDRRAPRPQIVGYGLRNPWRFSFDRRTGDLSIGDVGQEEVEEIDFVRRGRGRGANFGWRVFEGNERYAPGESAPGAVRPVITRLHKDGWCSITSGVVVRDPRLPGLAGRYVFGDICQSRIWSARLSPGRARDVHKTRLAVPSVSSFGEDARGRVYVTSIDGPVYRLAPR